jgi:hypothetical protein
MSSDLIGDKPKFFQYYLDMLDLDPTLDPEIASGMKDPSYRRELTSHGLDPALVVELAPYVRSMLAKPQRLLADDDDFYVAIDQMTNTYYVCYRDLLMIDLDNYKDPSAATIEERLQKLPRCMCQLQGQICGGDRGCGFVYRIFKSRNGYHVFLISHSMDPKSELALKLAIDGGSDYFYIIFSYLRGWSVRLNTKMGEIVGDQEELYSYYADLRQGQLSDPIVLDSRQVKLVDLHLRLCQVFAKVEPCISFNNK